jgi:hypothetical protein
MSWASVRLTASLERIGAWLRFSEGLLGIVTALGADPPEICSAFAALSLNHHEVGLGVVTTRLASSRRRFAGRALCDFCRCHRLVEVNETTADSIERTRT